MKRQRSTIGALAVIALACCFPSSAQEAAPDAVGELGELSYSRQISFSGYTWQVKTSSGKVGPGPNTFSDSASNVWVDSQGRLHLKITKVKKNWTCAEVVCNASLGHGTYRFFLDSPVDRLDPNVVLGLFTWNDDAAYNHREIDIELSRWGQVNNQNAQFVVQPYTQAANIHRFNMPSAPTSEHSFNWQAGGVSFQSVKNQVLPPYPADIVQEWTCTTLIPVPGGENPRMNLWLMSGKAPTNNAEVEIIVKSFQFIPGP
jgi:hypothetical protein